MSCKNLKLLKLALAIWRQKCETKGYRRMIWGCFFPQTRRTSDSLMIASSSTSTTNISDFDDPIISKLALLLDSKDAYRFSQTCRQFRKIVHSLPLQPFVTTHKELVYRFNCRTGRQEVHVLKIGRSIQGIRIKDRNVNVFAENLKDLLLPECIFKGTIIFENNVDVSSAFTEILDLNANGRIYPEVFRFHGGGFPKAISNTNSKKWGELELNECFQKLNCLKEVHFLASRHFEFHTAPTTLLYLCNQLSHFSFMHNEIQIQFNLEDIFTAVNFWRLITPTSSSNFHIHSPIMQNNNCVTLIEASRPFEPEYIEEEQLIRLTFFHPNDENIFFAFHFH